MDQERHGPLVFFTFFESWWFVGPSHHLIAAVSGEPELFSLQSIKSTIDELFGERGDAMQWSGFGIGLV